MTVIHERPTLPEAKPVMAPVLPPLENGDHLTRAEFERRYAAMPEVKKAELIEGKVYMASPVRIRHHGRPHSCMQGWLFVYDAHTTGVAAGDNSTIRLDFDNEPQPDSLLYIEPDFGGQCRESADGYLEGAPELAVEVAASTAAFDLYEKLNAFRRNGVREYLVWRVLDHEIDWFVLRDERYQRLDPGEDGIYRSEVFPGLWLDVTAMIGGDLQRVLAVLLEGLGSPEHQAFVEFLAGDTGQSGEGASSKA